VFQHPIQSKPEAGGASPPEIPAQTVKALAAAEFDGAGFLVYVSDKEGFCTSFGSHPYRPEVPMAGTRHASFSPPDESVRFIYLLPAGVIGDPQAFGPLWGGILHRDRGSHSRSGAVRPLFFYGLPLRHALRFLVDQLRQSPYIGKALRGLCS
jgi:hypothetical protein